MTKKYSGQMFLKIPVTAGIILAGICFLFSCATNTGPDQPVEKETAEKKTAEISPLVVPSPQEAVYNGEAQPLTFTYTGEEEVDVVYYPSAEARAGDNYGSYAAPVLAGVYYARVSIPEENVYAEYRIRRCPVKIEAAEIQNAVYNGNPKRVTAKSEQPVSLSYSYYPNRELRDTAVRAAEGSDSGDDSTRPLTMNFSGYKRVERAPIEQGTYYVWIYFPGDDNYEAAQAFVEFTILPPRQRGYPTQPGGEILSGVNPETVPAPGGFLYARGDNLGGHSLRQRVFPCRLWL